MVNTFFLFFTFSFPINECALASNICNHDSIKEFRILCPKVNSFHPYLDLFLTISLLLISRHCHELLRITVTPVASSPPSSSSFPSPPTSSLDSSALRQGPPQQVLAAGRLFDWYYLLQKEQENKNKQQKQKMLQQLKKISNKQKMAHLMSIGKFLDNQPTQHLIKIWLHLVMKNLQNMLYSIPLVRCSRIKK